MADSCTLGGATCTLDTGVSPAAAISSTSGGKLPHVWFALSTNQSLMMATTNSLRRQSASTGRRNQQDGFMVWMMICGPIRKAHSISLSGTRKTTQPSTWLSQDLFSRISARITSCNPPVRLDVGQGVLFRSIAIAANRNGESWRIMANGVEIGERRQVYGAIGSFCGCQGDGPWNDCLLRRTAVVVGSER